jgi:WD40 repeat protein
MSTITITEHLEKKIFNITEPGTCILLISKFIIVGTDKGKLVKFNSEDETYEMKSSNLKKIECLASCTTTEFWLAGDQNIYMFNIQLVQRKLIQGHLDLVTGLIFDGNRLISASEDTTIRLWNSPYSKSEVLYSHEFSITCFELCQEKNALASSDSDSNLYLHFLHSKYTQKTLNESQARIWCIKLISSKDYLLTADNDSCIIIRNYLNIALVLKQMKVGQSRIKDICLNKDQNLIAACGFDQSVFLIDVPEMVHKKIVLSSSDWIRAVRFNKDETCLVAVGDDRMLTFCKIGQKDETLKNFKNLNIWMNLASNGILLGFILIWCVIDFAIPGLFCFFMISVMMLAGFIYYWTKEEVKNRDEVIRFALNANLAVVMIVPFCLIMGYIFG